MQNTHSLDANMWTCRAREDVERLGLITYHTAMHLEKWGFDVGALERRLLDQQEAA